MADIILTTLNARYAHCAFGLRYLMVNLGELQARARILEFDINQRPLDVVEAILRHEPKIVGLGVYVWNTTQSLQVVADLKRLRPDLIVIIGGPEVSYECDQQEIVRLADHVITGEADLAFAELCRDVLVSPTPRPHIIPAPLPDFDRLALPYGLYTDTDIAHRVIYVEASRGCPYECEFCLSSLDVPVRNAPLEPFLAAMQRLLDRGVRQFKFVDRTFNLNLKISSAILQFFLERYRHGLFVHFEMIPDRLPQALREPIREFPPGALQFEVGIQTFNEEVAKLISRRQDNAKAEENLRWFARRNRRPCPRGSDRRLAGRGRCQFRGGIRPAGRAWPAGNTGRFAETAARHAHRPARPRVEHGLQSTSAVRNLQTKLIDFFTMQRLRRFARYWDLIANSGNFVETTPLLWRDGSPFQGCMRFSDWLYAQTRQTHSIALARLRALVSTYLTEEAARSQEEVRGTLQRDAQHSQAVTRSVIPPRQSRALARSRQSGRRPMRMKP